MNDLIRIIKQSISNGTNQLENVTKEDYDNLDILQKEKYIIYDGHFKNAPDIVDLEKGVNYDKL